MNPLSRRLLLGGLAALPLSAGARAQQPAQQPPAGPHRLPDLPYAFDANEAAIDARTMELHWRFHHGAQVNNLNAALRGQEELSRLPLDELLAGLSRAPDNLRTAIRNNAGGHANHAMFWEIMGGRGGEPADGPLRDAINRDLGGWGEFRNRFGAASMGVFGSGWAFVTVDREGRLAIETRPNQDSPLMDGRRVLMGNDLWEHAYYLRYQNRRAEYVGNWWNVLNWERIASRYEAARAGTLRV
jgi:Fe-Mn family superoxide dismutase